MNINCLFWNIKDMYNQERIDFLNHSALTCEIIILVEAYSSFIDTSITGFTLIQPLQTSGRQWVKIFIKKSITSFWLTRVDEMYHNRIVIANLTIPGKRNLNILGIHLNSKTGFDEKTQLLLNSIAAQEIHSYMRNKNNRTIIVGDFNHNPFESFMNSNLTINAVPNKELVKSLKYRTHTRERRVLFYNPMWNFLGDHNFRLNESQYNGTYFFNQKSHKLCDHIHWNLLDQILVSEPIVDCISPQNVEILHSYIATGGTTVFFASEDFYKKNKKYMNPKLSDHLPLSFKIDTTKYI